MRILLALLKACHLGPTLTVTITSFLLATNLWWEGPAFIIAFGVFLGQLLVGFTNDLTDYQDDLKHNRRNKPLVSGRISEKQLRTAIKIVAPFAVVVNIFGPLGIKGGLIYLFGVGMGISYNLYFKSTLLSPLPYAIAFAALVACIVVATDRNPPLWLMGAASLLGVAAHFANVLKDLDQDLTSGIKGLPQRLGKKYSRLIVSILLITTTLLLNYIHPNTPLLVIGLIAAAITSFAPNKLMFSALMITAVIDVMLMLNAAGSLIGSLVI
jgi:4-hydroxybenzoate polyprenyltransferase